jgi:Ca-activated chloride channel homolog
MKAMIRMVRQRRTLPVLLTALLVVFGACGDKETETGVQPIGGSKPGPRLTIVSGSENKGLEPLVREFARKEGADIRMAYMGSIDMTLMLADQGAAMEYDAVWPANSIWITLGDRNKVVKQAESIMRSPVVLGIKKPAAERLGWTDKDITISDILEATEAGRLRFAMTSATQSNSGASAYLGFLYAMAGAEEVLRMEDLQDPQVQEKVKKLLSRVDRSSGSSGWLKEALVDHYDRFQGMFNYEAMIIEANRQLVRKGREPLYAVYPTDGIMIADSPLGYVDKGDPAKEALFRKLQTFLLSDAVQDEILRQGRRTGLIGIQVDKVDKAVFNPAWGIDIERIISPVPTPSEPVIREALELYQTVLRKPSITAYVLDVSGSMKGRGINDLKAAMTTLLDPDQAKRYMLQPSPKDVHIIIPFNSAPLRGLRAEGNSPEVLGRLLGFVQGLSSGGGTNIYQAAVKALEVISREKNVEDYFPAVILMTDGKSSGAVGELQAAMSRLPMGSDIPIFSITFGEADESQLREISEISVGRVFPGHDLVKAFRNAKGYN